jgi:hypothetical protein
MQRLIEQPVDDGELMEGGRLLGAVHYHLSVYQQFSTADDETVPAHLEVEGHITPLEPIDLPALRRRNAELTLRLADGRILECSAADETGAIRSTGRGLHTP